MDSQVALVVTVTAASVLAVGSALLLAAALRHRARARVLAHEQQLAAAAAQIERLGEQVEELSAGVARVEAARRASARSHRAEEYVITTLAGTLAGAESAAASQAADDATVARAVGRTVSAPARPRLDLEGQLVGVLARQRGTTVVRDRAVEIVVHGVALAHGVRRALRPDTLDRAAAEAHVARRRSRRLRRAEVREARRLVRVLRDVA